MKQPKAAASLIVTRACQYVAAYDTKLPGEVGRIPQKGPVFLELFATGLNAALVRSWREEELDRLGAC